MYNEVSYKKYCSLAKKYLISKNSKNKTVKEKFLKACIELQKYDLMYSRIMDDFFENGERIANLCKNLIIEYSQYYPQWKHIRETYFRF